MGTVGLLTGEGEIASAKGIEEGLNQMTLSLASFPCTVQLLLEAWELHKAGKKRLAEIVVGFNDGLDDEPEPTAAPTSPAANAQHAKDAKATGAHNPQHGTERTNPKDERPDPSPEGKKD